MFASSSLCKLKSWGIIIKINFYCTNELRFKVIKTQNSHVPIFYSDFNKTDISPNNLITVWFFGLLQSMLSYTRMKVVSSAFFKENFSVYFIERVQINKKHTQDIHNTYLDYPQIHTHRCTCMCIPKLRKYKMPCI